MKDDLRAWVAHLCHSASATSDKNNKLDHDNKDVFLSPVLCVRTAFLISSALSDALLCLAREMLTSVYCYQIDHSSSELKVQEKRLAIELVIRNAFQQLW